MDAVQQRLIEMTKSQTDSRKAIFYILLKQAYEAGTGESLERLPDFKSVLELGSLPESWVPETNELR